MRERVGRNRPWLRGGALLAILLIWGLLLAGCQNVRSPQVVKIGLIAPFEGPSRPLGYDVLNAVKLRINQWNESDAQPKIELVALNDDSDPALAALLPAQLAQDPDIRLILGPPQGRTAAAAQAPLARTGIPTILLAPVKGAVSVTILPYAGIEQDYRRALQLPAGEVPAAWEPPVTQPVLWLGDPLTLAEVYATQPEMIVAAGPVAEEEAVQGWVPGLSQHLPWAAPVPERLPQDFPTAYQALTGKAPSHAASLAYAAADLALNLMASSPDHRPDASRLHSAPLPPVTIIHQ